MERTLKRIFEEAFLHELTSEKSHSIAINNMQINVFFKETKYSQILLIKEDSGDEVHHLATFSMAKGDEVLSASRTKYLGENMSKVFVEHSEMSKRLTLFMELLNKENYTEL